MLKLLSHSYYSLHTKTSCIPNSHSCADIANLFMVTCFDVFGPGSGFVVNKMVTVMSFCSS